VSEIAAMLRGDISREDAAARGAQATRNYAKRQYTWLRHQPPVEWARLDRRIEESFDMPANFVSLFRG
jgi:tRNA dimethylallyltransferase